MFLAMGGGHPRSARLGWSGRAFHSSGIDLEVQNDCVLLVNGVVVNWWGSGYCTPRNSGQHRLPFVGTSCNARCECAAC